MRNVEIVLVGLGVSIGVVYLVYGKHEINEETIERMKEKVRDKIYQTIEEYNIIEVERDNIKPEPTTIDKIIRDTISPTSVHSVTPSGVNNLQYWKKFVPHLAKKGFLLDFKSLEESKRRGELKDLLRLEKLMRYEYYLEDYIILKGEITDVNDFERYIKERELMRTTATTVTKTTTTTVDPKTTT